MINRSNKEFYKLHWGDKNYSIYGDTNNPLIHFGDICEALHINKDNLPKYLFGCKDTDFAMIPNQFLNLVVQDKDYITFSNQPCTISKDALLISAKVLKKIETQQDDTYISAGKFDTYRDALILLSQHHRIIRGLRIMEFRDQIKEILANSSKRGYLNGVIPSADEIVDYFFRPIVVLNIDNENVKRDKYYFVRRLYYTKTIDISMCNDVFARIFDPMFTLYLYDNLEGKFLSPELLLRILQIAARVPEFESMVNLKQKNISTYLMKDTATGMVKIGRSIHPAKREHTLQADKPTIELLYTTPENIESKLHKEFDAFRMRGEWFNLTQKQIDYIVKTYNFTKNTIDYD